MDPATGLPLVDLILDEAGQKGTGKWTSQNALDIGVPVPTINAALQGRIISSLKKERVFAATQLPASQQKYEGDPAELIDAVENALYASTVTSYAQGLAMLRMASQEYNMTRTPRYRHTAGGLHHPASLRRHHGCLRTRSSIGQPDAG